MIREYEINPEHGKNSRAPLWRFSNSPLASTKDEQYLWALDDYWKGLSKYGSVFPAYMTESGYIDMDAVNRAKRNAGKSVGWLTRPAAEIVGGIDEMNKQDQAHRFYRMPIVHDVMENTRKDLENRIYGDLQDHIINRKIGLRHPFLVEEVEGYHPLEKKYVAEYLRNRFDDQQ